MKNGIPELLNEDDRNFDLMILGRKVARYPTGTKTLDVRSSKRNLFTDLLVFLRYAGFLSKDADVIVCLNRNDTKGILATSVSPFDRKYLHIVTLMEVDRCRSRLIERIRTKVDTLCASRIRVPSKSMSEPAINLKSLAEALNRINAACNDAGFRLSVSLDCFDDKELDELSLYLAKEVQVLTQKSWSQHHA